MPGYCAVAVAVGAGDGTEAAGCGRSVDHAGLAGGGPFGHAVIRVRLLGLVVARRVWAGIAVVYVAPPLSLLLACALLR